MRTNPHFVETDVTELRNFLLTDTVLEARNAIVTRPLVENYMLNRFTSNSSLFTREDVLGFLTKLSMSQYDNGTSDSNLKAAVNPSSGDN
jgi:hypothetical protein